MNLSKWIKYSFFICLHGLWKYKENISIWLSNVRRVLILFFFNSTHIIKINIFCILVRIFAIWTTVCSLFLAKILYCLINWHREVSQQLSNHANPTLISTCKKRGYYAKLEFTYRFVIDVGHSKGYYEYTHAKICIWI